MGRMPSQRLLRLTNGLRKVAAGLRFATPTYVHETRDPRTTVDLTARERSRLTIDDFTFREVDAVGLRTQPTITAIFVGVSGSSPRL